MIGKGDINQIKKNIETCIGGNVTIKANTGRNRITCKTGIVEKAYQNLFVVKIDDTSKNISYNYTDLLTNMLEITSHETQDIIGSVGNDVIHTPHNDEMIESL